MNTAIAVVMAALAVGEVTDDKDEFTGRRTLMAYVSGSTDEPKRPVALAVMLDPNKPFVPEVSFAVSHKFLIEDVTVYLLVDGQRYSETCATTMNGLNVYVHCSAKTFELLEVAKETVRVRIDGTVLSFSAAEVAADMKELRRRHVAARAGKEE